MISLHSVVGATFSGSSLHKNVPEQVVGGGSRDPPRLTNTEMEARGYDVWSRAESKEDSGISWNISQGGADSLWAVCNLATGVGAKMDQRKGQRWGESVET